jgi:uncharacterized protein YigA (DUF484 family)
MVQIAAARVAQTFVEAADTLVEDFDLAEFLHRVVTRTAELAGVPAVGLLLADPTGALRVVAASDQATQELEELQLRLHQGPCVDAFTTGAAVVNADLSQAGGRWPLFAPHAVQSGFGSVHALPLRLRGTVIGALTLFSADAGRLQAQDVRLIQALADIATIALLQERAIHRNEVLADQLQQALNSRVVIEQAKGALARAFGIGVDEAFVLLRSHARNHNRKLTDLAHLVVSDPATAAALSQATAPAPVTGHLTATATRAVHSPKPIPPRRSRAEHTHSPGAPTRGVRHADPDVPQPLEGT